MDLAHFLDELLIVIVLFKKRPEQSSAYTSIQTVLDIFDPHPDIFIYDNSPESCSMPDDRITYRHDPENSGVSVAYNEALGLATKKNKKWMLLLDQDTNIKMDTFEKFLDSILEHPDSSAFVPKMTDHLGLVSPFRLSFSGGKRIAQTENVLSLEKYRFINSGLLIKSSAFKAAGGYEESIPLDFSDVAFGAKLKKTTDHFIVVPSTVSHSFSGSSRQDLHSALLRFQFFCKGAFQMGKHFGPFYVYCLRACLRAFHLCYEYKTLRFLRILIKHMVHG